MRANDEIRECADVGLGTTVFEVMSALARQHQSVNLGQGFPDDKGPEEVGRPPPNI